MVFRFKCYNLPFFGHIEVFLVNFSETSETVHVGPWSLGDLTWNDPQVF